MSRQRRRNGSDGTPVVPARSGSSLQDSPAVINQYKIVPVPLHFVKGIFFIYFLSDDKLHKITNYKWQNSTFTVQHGRTFDFDY
jgi:hypothetical protein